MTPNPNRHTSAEFNEELTDALADTTIHRDRTPAQKAVTRAKSLGLISYFEAASQRGELNPGLNIDLNSNGPVRPSFVSSQASHHAMQRAMHHTVDETPKPAYVKDIIGTRRQLADASSTAEVEVGLIDSAKVNSAANAAAINLARAFREARAAGFLDPAILSPDALYAAIQPYLGAAEEISSIEQDMPQVANNTEI